MLAHRWEKPSTAQDERRALIRARRLCKKKKRPAKEYPSKAGRKESPIIMSRSRYDDRSWLDSRYIGIIRDVSKVFGIRAERVEIALNTVPKYLAASVSDAEDLLVQIKRFSMFSSPPQLSASLKELSNQNDIVLLVKWEPDNMKRTCVIASPGFCGTIAGMTVAEFLSGLEDCQLPIPCTITEFLAYFWAGALHLGEGRTSWTRCKHCLLL